MKKISIIFFAFVGLALIIDVSLRIFEHCDLRKKSDSSKNLKIGCINFEKIFQKSKIFCEKKQKADQLRSHYQEVVYKLENCIKSRNESDAENIESKNSTISTETHLAKQSGINSPPSPNDDNNYLALFNEVISKRHKLDLLEAELKEKCNKKILEIVKKIAVNLDLSCVVDSSVFIFNGDMFDVTDEVVFSLDKDGLDFKIPELEEFASSKFNFSKEDIMAIVGK